MHDAMCKITALSGFTANVLDNAEEKSYPKTKKIQNISRIHHVRYNYSEAKTKFHVWQYSSIGRGKNLMYLLNQTHQNLKKR